MTQLLVVDAVLLVKGDIGMSKPIEVRKTPL